MKAAMGTFLNPEKIGFLGWIQNNQSGETIFIDLKGHLCSQGKIIDLFKIRKRQLNTKIPFNPSSR